MLFVVSATKCRDTRTDHDGGGGMSFVTCTKNRMYTVLGCVSGMCKSHRLDSLLKGIHFLKRETEGKQIVEVPPSGLNVCLNVCQIYCLKSIISVEKINYYCVDQYL